MVSYVPNEVSNVGGEYNITRNKCNVSLVEMSSLDNNKPSSDTYNDKGQAQNENKFYLVDPDPLDTLKKIKTSNLNRLVISQVNINSLRNKFESLESIIKDNLDILVINESILDESFSSLQFAIEGYALPYRMDIG